MIEVLQVNSKQVQYATEMHDNGILLMSDFASNFKTQFGQKNQALSALLKAKKQIYSPAPSGSLYSSFKMYVYSLVSI